MAASGEADPAVAAERDRRAKLVHDLRTPLTIVGGFADMLEARGETLSREQRDEFVARIAEGARELRAILDAEREERVGD